MIWVRYYFIVSIFLFFLFFLFGLFGLFLNFNYFVSCYFLEYPIENTVVIASLAGPFFVYSYNIDVAQVQLSNTIYLKIISNHFVQKRVSFEHRAYFITVHVPRYFEPSLRMTNKMTDINYKS